MIGTKPMIPATLRLKALWLGMWLIGFSLNSRIQGEQAEVRPSQGAPNFVIILCDDLGYGDIGPFGNTIIKTPNLDRMAGEGLKLTAFHAAGNVCTPSRAGLLTGRYAVRMGLAYRTLEVNDERGLPEKEWTLAEALRAQGYATACVGKWHLGDRAQFHPSRHGFDEFFGLPYSNDMKPLPLMDGEKIIEEPAEQATLTQRYTRRAVEFITSHREAPFFLYLAHSMPHVPLHASEEFRGRSAAGEYGDAVEELDWSVGEILGAIRAQGLDEKTLVIFTSDNGPWFEGSAGNNRGRKGEPWNGGFLVPFLARWPGKVPAGQASDAVGCGLDVMPTLLDLAGAKTPDGVQLDGRSISEIFLHPGRAPDWISERPVFMFDDTTLSAVRRGEWLFSVATRYREGTIKLDESRYYKPGLLFNLARDPSASFSLTSREPKLAAEMAKLVETARADFGTGRGRRNFATRLLADVSVKRIAAASVIGIAAAFLAGYWSGRRSRRGRQTS